MFADAFLASWNDVAPDVEPEYQHWHRVEHMPERLAIPGFTLGRRYVDLAALANRYLTVYEVESIETFASETYRARLALPTSETTRMATHMRNFVRRIFRTVATEGVAIGGAAAVFRLQLHDVDASSLARAVHAVDGTVGAHIGAIDTAISGLRSDNLQLQMAATDAKPFDGVLLAEADSRAAAQARLSAWKEAIEKRAGTAAIVTAQIYDLALVYRPLYDTAAVLDSRPLRRSR